VESNTEAIVRLAWSRILGLGDGALDHPATEVLTRPDDTVITYVRLWDHRVLIGPPWALALAPAVAENESSVATLMLTAAAEHGGGRLLGQSHLAFTDAYVPGHHLETAVVTDDPAAVVDLEGACPPDDVTEVGLAGMARALVTLDELDRPTAGAGYQEWQGIVGHLGVLTPPQFRRQGFGVVAAAIATNDALDAGLVPQWRSRVENQGSRRVAARLGFVEVGSQTTVLLNPWGSAGEEGDGEAAEHIGEADRSDVRVTGQEVGPGSVELEGRLPPAAGPGEADG
jgi:hypothetical protein